ncbi:VWA domain-containing protein [Williamsia sp. 1135]|uniref:vWA domain-containing protein n=1 Tax=Williamsia sp. 1135 TaxID=1889262 RepID=UPI00117F1D62|nr:VWA domain-containing protein [Williamsia sp. 1135]
MITRPLLPVRPRRVMWLALAAIVIVVMSACTSADNGQAVPDQSNAAPKITADIPPTALVIDASDSMLTDDAPGLRIEAAKRAANTLVDALPADSELAILTYGTGTGNSPAEYGAGCLDVTEIVPLGALDVAGSHDAINELVPRGYTPIAESLRRAAAVLTTDTPAAIVLISDGEDICADPPCEVARQLKLDHPELEISTVGFKTQGQASADLKCIADATGGVFVTAANPAQLEARLLATQNSDASASALNGDTLQGITLGQTLADIRVQHNDFPAGGTRRGDQTIIIWADCEWIFGPDGSLQEINPGDTARTIDGLTLGDTVADAIDLYGEPVTDTTDGSGRSLVFAAQPDSDIGYRIGADGVGSAAIITSMVVCRCVPGSGGTGSTASAIERPFTRSGGTAPGWLKDTTRNSYGYFGCDAASVPGVVDDGIYWCSGPSGDGQGPCAPTVGSNYVLCVTDPFTKTLTLVAPTRPLPGAKPVAASPELPLGLVLADGTQCRYIKNRGVAPGGGRAGWSAPYNCGAPRDQLFVWAGQGADPIERTGSGWVVQVGGPDANVRQVSVTEAVYIGFAP